MVKVFEGTDQEYYMDGYLLENLKLAKEKVRDDWDFVFVIDGTERGGKSTLAQQIGKYVYPELSIDDIVFTPKQFEEAVKNAKPYSCVIYDEAYGGLGARSTMSSVNKTLVRMLTEIGFKNLFVIICIPSSMDLDRYVILWRCKALLSIYTGESWERGYFKCYNKERLKDLYMKGKKFYDYSVVKPNFYGRFTRKYLVNKEEYMKKKREAVENREEKRMQEEEAKEIMFHYLMQNAELSHAERIKALRMPESTYFYKLDKLKNENY